MVIKQREKILHGLAFHPLSPPGFGGFLLSCGAARKSLLSCGAARN